MKDRMRTSQLDRLFADAIGRGDGLVQHELTVIVEEDTAALEYVRGTLLAQLLSRTLTNGQVRRAAELLTGIEKVRRRTIRARITAYRREFEGIERMYTSLARTPRSRLPFEVTTKVCHDLGFAKSMYSSVRGQVWAPITIAIHNELGGFDDLRRAVNGEVVPKGAAPREEGIMRRPRGMAVEYADTLRDTYKPLIELSRPRGYVVVPVVAGGQVCGIIHADHNHLPIDAPDLEVLRTVGDICSSAEETALLRSRCESQHRRIQDELIAMQSALADLEKSRVSFAEAAGGDPAATSDTRTPVALTTREYEVFELVARGRPNAEIARRLFVSQTTVKSHIGRIYRKLGISTKAEAAAAYRCLALRDTEDDGDQI
ncbi:helix-turn-helix domain-containing protein [Nocardia higoensis]|uniref:helix-turn-helix domain-containing protein n=1 Tax=Nocardia higoensis TaxID=228599 RepID=UPI00030D3F07|nr:helix-turn-helix transcriptional regulator [Nocardia higoensis]